MKSDAISGCTDEDQPQFWSSHYSSTNNHLHYLLEVRMRATSAWGQVDGHACLKAMCFYSCHSRQVDVATWSFLVLPIDKENPYRLSRGWYIYILSSFLHHTAYIDRNLPVGDNRGTVNTSPTLHISDQLGTENACKTLLCWVIVMIRALVCNNMYQYEHHFGSFYHNPTILEAVSIH